MASCSKGEQWTELFNGQDLSNWDKYIGPPFKGHENLAATATPDSVFSVVDVNGEKMIRISGEVFGSLATKDKFSNFHARIVMKWGTKITTELNCGLLYYGHGPFGAGFNTWKSSIECQLQHGNMGGLYVIGDDVSLKADAAVNGDECTYQQGADAVTFSKASGKRMIKGAVNAENPVGEWNTIDIYCVGQQAVHMVNGKVTARISDISTISDGKTSPLTEGCLQLQSEGSELFVKSVEIRQIDKIPDALLKD